MKTLPQIFNEMTTAQKAFFAITEVSGGNTITIASSADVINYIKFKYFNYTTPLDLTDCFTSYKAITLSDMLKAYHAYEMEYNPIHNYDRDEKNIRQKAIGTDTTTHTPNTTVTRTPNITNATTHGLTQTTSYTNRETMNDVTTYDSTNYRPDDKTTESGSTSTADTGTDSTATTGTETTATTGTDTTTNSHTATSLTDDNTTYSGNEVEIATNKMSGNIGVMSTQQMLNAERDLRMSPIIEIYLDKFVNNYCFMRLNYFDSEE